MMTLRRPLTRLLLGVALFLFIAPAAASAHAVLDNSVPASGATLAESPPQIVLDFDERVETAVGFVKLFDSLGTRIALPSISRDAADASIVRVNVPTLDNDTYVAVYRVVSADGHPVDGAITFQVGEGKRADVSGVIADALSENATDGTVSDAMRGVRLIGYLALALVMAGLVFLLGGAVVGGEARTVRIVGAAGAILAVCLVRQKDFVASGGPAPAGKYDLSTYRGVLGTGADAQPNAAAGDASSLLLTRLGPDADAALEVLAGLVGLAATRRRRRNWLKPAASSRWSLTRR